MGLRRVKEIPGGAIDGVNITYTTTATFVPTTVFVYRNGQQQPKDFLTELGDKKSFELCEALETDEDLHVEYTAVVT